MKRIQLFLALAILIIMTPAARLGAEPLGPWGRNHRVGVGVNLGSPTGFSGKYWFDRESALDVAIGVYGYYAGRYTGSMNLHADYLWHMYGIFGSPESAAYEHLPIYIGLGAIYSSPDVTGIRAVAGISWLFEDAPFDLFFDVAPTLVIAPGFTGLSVEPGLGGRFYF